MQSHVRSAPHESAIHRGASNTRGHCGPSYGSSPHRVLTYVWGGVLLEDEGFIVVEGGQMQVVETFVVFIGTVLCREGSTEIAASTWCRTLNAP